jgi:hypothetical protein
MDNKTLLLLVVFNLLIWWIVISRLIALAKNATRKIATVFAVGMLFQGVHSVILPFGNWFQQFFSGKIVNFLEIGCATVSAFLLYFTAELFWKYSLSIEEDEAIHRPKSKTKFFEPTRVLFLGMITTLAMVLILDVLLAGQINNLLTPSSTDIKRNAYILLSRFVSMGYIVVTESTTAFIFLRLMKTSYGKHHAVRVFAAAISIFTHASHFAANLIATIILFFVDYDNPFWGLTQQLYLQFDTIILIPLGLSFFVAVSPSWLIDGIKELLSIYQLMYYRKRIAWLRNLLIKIYPGVELPISIYTNNKWKLFNKMRYETTRHVIECSDVLHHLGQDTNTKYLAKTESISRISTSTNIDFYTEALLIAKAIDLSSDKKPIPLELTKQLATLSVFRAQSLNDLFWLYANLAIKLSKLKANS